MNSYHERRKRGIDEECLGKRFGRLTVLRRENKQYVCLCDCGNIKNVRPTLIRGGSVRSCGCLRRDNCSELGHSRLTNGLYCRDPITSKRQRSRELNSYWAMMTRCYNVKDPAYIRYGGSGKLVCDRWKGNPLNFIEDMGPRPENTTLDRIDNSKGYFPENCRWSGPNTQGQNKGDIKLSLELASKIKGLRAQGFTAREIRRELGLDCCLAAINGAAAGETWNED